MDELRKSLVIFRRYLLALTMMGLITCSVESRVFMNIETPVVSPLDRVDAPGVYMRTVIDKRVFQSSDKSGIYPAWDAETVDKSEKMKKRVIGRTSMKKSVLLESGQTVESIVRNIWKSELSKAGYVVMVDKSRISRDTLTMDIYINNFWSHTKRRRANVVHSNIETLTVISKGKKSQQIPVFAHGVNPCRRDNKPNIEIAYDRGVIKYIEEVKKHISHELIK